MAAEARRKEAAPVKRRPMSAPKSSEMTAIPRIVLEHRVGDQEPGGDPATSGPTLSAPNGPGPRPVSGGADSPELREYVPHRCNSDIGLPTASMPNLSLALGMGENGAGDKLGVYCSPRTTRRSVDLDVGPRDPAARAEYEWLEDKTSSLRVLSAGSRVGSAVSLNSVCTAHSVGLLSNDSDDDYQEASLHDGSVSGAAPHSERAGQLRRLQSYPEEDKTGSDAGVTPRTSHSLCNLKAVQAPAAVVTVDGQGHVPVQGQGQGRGQLTPEKLCLLPCDLDESDDRVLPPGDGEGKREERGGQRAARREVYDDGKKVHMVSYGKGSASMREGRIRRWLQDMDKASE